MKQLQLFLDQEGFIPCGGRIHNAPLTELTRFPYLLPAKHQLTRMIVLDAHATQLHAGTSALVSHIRQRYWIPSIRQYIQGLLKKCVTCRKVMGKQYRAPDPPPLPKIRVQDATPFTVTGVDFTGELHIRGKSGIENAFLHVRQREQFISKLFLIYQPRPSFKHSDDLPAGSHYLVP